MHDATLHTVIDCIISTCACTFTCTYHYDCCNVHVIQLNESRKVHTYLYQGHLGLIGELDLLLLGGVGVVLVLVEPLLEWARHVV